MRSVPTCARGAWPILLGHAGNREDADLRAVAATAAGFRPELAVLKDSGGYERGRGPGEIAAIMRAELLRTGIGEDAIVVRLDEVEAARCALEWARDGDLLVLPIHELAARDHIVSLLDRLQETKWRPRMPLPEIAEMHHERHAR